MTAARFFLRTGAFISAAGLLLTAVPAARAEAGWFEGDVSRLWLRTYDPTLIGRRVVSEFSFEDDRGGVGIAKLSTTVRDSVLVAPGLAAGAQIELPVEWHSADGDVVSGLADFETRAGMVGRISKSLRWGTALNLKFPTGTAPVLTDPFTMKPLLALSWDATVFLNLGLTTSYEFTPGTSGTGQVSELHLDMPVAVNLSDRWSAAATYKPEWDFLTGQFIHKLETGFSVLLGAKRQFALSPALELPLSRQTMEWKAIVSMAWYF